MLRITLSIALLLTSFNIFSTAVSAEDAAEQSSVTIQPIEGQAHRVEIDGKPFTVYRHAAAQPKPYFHPVVVDGVEITRPLDDPKDRDHPHHKGIWISVDEVNGVKFWNEDGRIVNTSVRPTERKGHPAIAVRNEWKNDAGETLLVEETVTTLFPDRMMVVEITVVGKAETVTFGDTKEGLLGFRMASSLREKETGIATGSDGTVGTKANWGRVLPWIDYSGTVDGKVVGLALFDSETNFRSSRYHVRGYGLFAINPFGPHAYSYKKEEPAPVTLKRGETLSLVYGVYPHTGDVKTGKIADAYARFTERVAELRGK